jgi:uncharacterized oxidoreductase
MTLTFISAEKLKLFAARLLARGGFTSDEGNAIAESLVLSELLGHGSHGVMRVPEYLNDLKKGCTVSGAQLNVLHETPNALIADAQYGAGQVVMPALLKKLQTKLETQPVVSAAVRHCGHIGRVGEWVEIPAEAGYPGLLMANDNGGIFSVAPPGGKQGVTSTNPIAFAVPLPDGKVFMTDMSTSAIAFGKVKLARINRAAVARHCIQDAEGNATTNPEALFTDPKGSILPMGGEQGYKGFALSMFMDMLVAGLSGGQTPPAENGSLYANNIIITLWNPKFFAGLAHMQQQAAKYIGFVRASSPVKPDKPIRLAGDRMLAVKQERQTTGIPLNQGLADSLLSLAKTLGVAAPSEFTG